LGPVRRDELVLLTQPISHASGFFVLPYLISGAGVFVQPRFDPEALWHLSRKDEMRTLKVVPAMLEPILAADDGTWGFERIVYGASSIPLPVLEASVERFGPILMQDYGQSEAPITITCLTPEDHLDPLARSSAGRPWRTVAVDVCDDDGQTVAPGELGEVCVRGTHMMSGYLGRPDDTEAVLRNGWLRTKDLAIQDDRGYIHLRGRRDEMIVTGGFNVAPREVEDVLTEHGAVDEAVVFGTPDQRWGEAVTAIVRVRPGQQLTEQALIEFVRPRLGMRTPKRVMVWSQIPRNAYGKVDKAQIRRQMEEGGQS
jgi:acyl-CoA synthetase (AMP-forming)/AMP-acid ligase II